MTLLRRLIQPLTGLLAWVYLYLLLLLAAWVCVATIATGWAPVVVTSGSMQPTLRPGDVLLLDDAPDEGLLAQRTVVTFRPADDPDSLVTHRIFAVGDDHYITKGDANPTPDTDPLPAGAVEGVGRLVIPLVGLPLLWAMEGNIAAMVAWAIATLGAITVAGVGFRSLWRRERRDRQDRQSPMAATAVRRVRTLIGAMIVSQFVIDASRFDIDGLGIARWQVMVTAISMLGLINAVSLKASRSGDPQRLSQASVFELLGDTVMVIFLTTATGTSGIGWVLFALPIIEAAARFKLAGALLHWMALTGIALASRIWMIERAAGSSTELIDELERMLDQLSVLLLVVIPGAHLVEQLTSDILAQRTATDEAVERGRLLQLVAETGREVNRLGVEVFSTILDAMTALGFDRADVSARVGDGDWNVLAAVGDDPLPMPPPGSPGSAMRTRDLVHREACVTSDDPDDDDRLALTNSGSDLLVRMSVSERDDTQVALRATSRDRAALRPGAIEAMRLLCGQATVALQNEQLVSELREIHDEMEHQATHDSLTGLPNRASFVAQLARALDHAPDPSRRHAVLFLDLDGFKPVNDTLGHEAGDRLLEAIARRLESIVKKNGIIARLGGDEFTILLRPVPHPTIAEGVARDVQRALQSPFRIGDETVRVGTSIGIAYAEAGMGGPELLRRADAAMYAAKSRRGEIPSITYHPSLDEADRRRARMADEFVKALRSDELALHYQPLIDATTERVVGVEALLRWTHREHGPVKTESILQLAENGNLMVELNRWILKRAAIDTLSWAIPTSHDFFVTVNASPSELASDYFTRNVEDALKVSGLPPHNLVVELSERILGSDAAHLDTIDRLARMGVRLALDDFGEGKTSLAHLRGLPIGMLKIDRTLVQHAVLSRPDRIILESVASLGHELGYLVVAEGIETAEQAAACTAAGADLFQGYLFHRPVPPDEIAVLIRQAVEHRTLTEINA
jgi:signal peptidase I